MKSIPWGSSVVSYNEGIDEIPMLQPSLPYSSSSKHFPTFNPIVELWVHYHPSPIMNPSWLSQTLFYLYTTILLILSLNLS